MIQALNFSDCEKYWVCHESGVRRPGSGCRRGQQIIIIERIIKYFFTFQDFHLGGGRFELLIIISMKDNYEAHCRTPLKVQDFY